MRGERVPEDPEEIVLLETLEDEVVCDLYVCSILKFLHELYLTTSCDIVMTVMLGRLEQTCLGETLLERNASRGGYS